MPCHSFSHQIRRAIAHRSSPHLASSYDFGYSHSLPDSFLCGGFALRTLALVLIALLSPAVTLAQRLDKSFAPPGGGGGFDPNAILGAPPPPPKKEDLPALQILEALPPPPPPKIWSGGVEFGMNGSEGNSQVFKLRFGANAQRDTPSNLFRANVVYGIATIGGVTNENKMLFSSIDEFRITDSNWSPFVSNAVEYDDFRDYDFRVAGHAGASYQFIKNEWTILKTRLGAGSSAEFASTGNQPTQWIPEGLVGYDFEYKFSQRQRFVSSMDYFPDIVDISRYRIRFRAAYEILVDPEWGLVLRFGVQDRYDSKPGNSKANDIDYFATLLLRF